MGNTMDISLMKTRPYFFRSGVEHTASQKLDSDACSAASFIHSTIALVLTLVESFNYLPTNTQFDKSKQEYEMFPK